MVPKGHLSLIIGDGGTGKSFLALHLGLCIATGQKFLGKGVQRGRVLYLDYELNSNELQRRASQVASGMDIDLHGSLLRKNIFYKAPKAPLGSEKHEKEVDGLIEELEADFVIVDSLTEGAAGDMKDHSDFNRVAREIRQWPTTLAIDHVTHSGAKKKSKNARPFGSVFKRNIARSTLNLEQGAGDVHLLQQDKSNFSEGHAQITYEMGFSSNCVSFDRLNMNDEQTDAVLSELSSYEVTLTAIQRVYTNTEDPVRKEEVHEWREEKDEGISLTTLRNHYTKLKERGEIESPHGQGAVPVQKDNEPSAQ